MNKTILRASLLSAVLLLSVNEAVASAQIDVSDFRRPLLGQIALANKNLTKEALIPVIRAYNAKASGAEMDQLYSTYRAFVDAQAKDKTIDQSKYKASFSTHDGDVDVDYADLKPKSVTPAAKASVATLDPIYETQEAYDLTELLTSFEGAKKLADIPLNSVDQKIDISAPAGSAYKDLFSKVAKITEFASRKFINRAILIKSFSEILEGHNVVNAVAAIVSTATPSAKVTESALQAEIKKELQKVVNAYNLAVAGFKKSDGVTPYDVGALFDKDALGPNDLNGIDIKNLLQIFKK